MQAAVEPKLGGGETVTVTLSYDNVQQLHEAMLHMGNSGSRNLFTLSKTQDDGTTVIVAVCQEQNNRDWEGR